MSELVQLRVPRRTEARWAPSRLVEPRHDETRPLTRGECVDAPRPCPWVGCRHHLGIDVNDTGSITIRFATAVGTPHRPAYDDGIAWDAMAESCALDVADRGGATLEEVGDLLNVTRERVRQIEADALETMRSRADWSDR